MIAAIIIAYVIQSLLAFWILLKVDREMNRKLGMTLTNGDVVFLCVISLMPLSLPTALLIGVVEGIGPAWTDWANRRSPLDR